MKSAKSREPSRGTFRNRNKESEREPVNCGGIIALFLVLCSPEQVGIELSTKFDDFIREDKTSFNPKLHIYSLLEDEPCLSYLQQ